MLKKEITYKNFDGDETTRTFYFNLTKAEWLELEVKNQGLQKMMERTIETRDVETMHNLIKNFVLAGYGARDGDDFIKSEDLRHRFMATEAYSNLFLELLGDDKKAIDFIRGMLPADMMKEFDENISTSTVSNQLKAPESPIPPPPMPQATVEAGRQIIEGLTT